MNRYDINLHDSNGQNNIIPSIIIIDSADRDTLSDSPNSYTITLKKPLRDVRKIKLVQCSIPNSNYNVSGTKTKIHVTVASSGTEAPDTSGTTSGTTLTLDDGFYEYDDIITILQTLINAEFAGANMTITLDSLSNKFLFTCDRPFSLYFDGGIVDGKRVYRTGSIGDILGFRPANYGSTANGSGAYEIESSYPHNLDLDRYIILKIKGMSRYDSVNKNIQDAFCIIPLDVRTDKFIQNINNIDNESLTYQFAKGSKLQKLVIEFLDWQGNAYDFRGLDHFMTFEVISESHRTNGLPRPYGVF